MNLHNPVSFADMPTPDPRFADDAARLDVLQSFEPDALEDDPELAAINSGLTLRYKTDQALIDVLNRETRLDAA